MENITYRKQEGVFYVKKMIDWKVYVFGKFKTLEEAKLWRDYFRNHDWNIGLIGVAKTNGVIDKSKRH